MFPISHWYSGTICPLVGVLLPVVSRRNRRHYSSYPHCCYYVICPPSSFCLRPLLAANYCAQRIHCQASRMLVAASSLTSSHISKPKYPLSLDNAMSESAFSQDQHHLEKNGRSHCLPITNLASAALERCAAHIPRATHKLPEGISMVPECYNRLRPLSIRRIG